MARKFVMCTLPRFALVVVAGLVLTSCIRETDPEASIAAQTPSPDVPVVTVSSSPTLTVTELLQQSWQTYRRRFIQADGRVIDWEADSRTVSEGQAYAMLRAVFANDPNTFELTLQWAENNLQRKINGRQQDSLWAWKWGQDAQGNWGIIDANFASDADLDAATALILAARKWNRPDYLDLARTKLKDLWQLSTIEVQNTRQLLPGPVAAFQIQPAVVKLNPSYVSPASFRLFAQVDPDHDWMSLVESSYELLEDSVKLSAVGLPSDWVLMDTATGAIAAVQDAGALQTVYSFDAIRVWWRVALDATWFQEPRAEQFLRQQLGHLRDLWRSQQSIPARIDLQGQPLVNYESTAQYAMLYPAFRQVDPTLAEQIFQQKLIANYKNGFWDNNSAYYVQNLAWLGLFAPTELAPELIQPQ